MTLYRLGAEGDRPLSTVAQGIPCPSGSGFTLTFRVTAAGPPAAVATGPGACGQVTLRVNGKGEPPLLPPDELDPAPEELDELDAAPDELPDDEPPEDELLDDEPPEDELLDVDAPEELELELEEPSRVST